jgi:hypothetical protein
VHEQLQSFVQWELQKRLLGVFKQLRRELYWWVYYKLPKHMPQWLYWMQKPMR